MAKIYEIPRGVIVYCEYFGLSLNTLDYVGCTSESICTYIECQFIEITLKGMHFSKNQYNEIRKRRYSYR